MSELNSIALKILSNGKGILAADESTATMTKRLESVKVPSTPENRLSFRQTLFSAKSMSSCIGGVILYDETIKQKTSNNKKIPDLINSVNSIPGIKVDTGAKVLAGSPDEKITEGLDGLRDRLKEYYKLGARFTKWRGVYNIAEKYPSKLAINSNAHALARYAALVQECNMVPIVEPEVLMDGNHTIQQCYETSDIVLNNVFEQLELLDVDLESIVLKPNMILPGAGSQIKISNQEIADMTYQVLKKNVPKKVPGIAFLSGGQSSDLAAERLNLLNSKYINERPWKLTFSYGRALQEDALFAWAQGDNNKTQHALINRAKMNHLASHGEL